MTRRCQILFSSPRLVMLFTAPSKRGTSAARRRMAACGFRSENAATLFALVKEEGVFNTQVRLIGEIPKATEVPVARHEPAKNRDTRNPTRDTSRAYVRNYTADDDNDDTAANAQQPRSRPRSSPDPRTYYVRPPYYQQRYYGRGIFQSGW